MRIFVILWVLLLAGCALPGPTPTDKNFAAATGHLKDIDRAEVIVEGSWVANVKLGSMMSFGSEMMPGRLMLTPDVFYFIIWEGGGGRFLPAYEMPWRDIQWVTTSAHGMARIVRIQAENAVHSFIFQHGVNLAGEEVDKDTVVRYIVDHQIAANK